VNMKGSYDIVTVGEFEGGDIYSGGFNPAYSQFASWCHWPVSILPSDRYDTVYEGRTGHSSLNHVYTPIHDEQTIGSAHYVERVLLEGLTTDSAVESIPLAKSWLSAPTLASVSGATDHGYDKAQRAFVLSATSTSASFTINASSDNPVVNPCFVIKNWGPMKTAVLSVDSVPVPLVEFRQGLVTDVDGTEKMVIWYEFESTSPVEIVVGQKIDFVAPAAPTGLVAMPADGCVLLDWDDNGEPDMGAYSVYRSTTSASGYTKIGSSTNSAYSDASAALGQTYY